MLEITVAMFWIAVAGAAIRLGWEATGAVINWFR